MPGTDGLLHVSEIANHRVKDVRDELKEGEQILVKVINIDPTGKIRLSRKALLQEEGAAPAEPCEILRNAVQHLTSGACSRPANSGAGQACRARLMSPLSSAHAPSAISADSASCGLRDRAGFCDVRRPSVRKT